MRDFTNEELKLLVDNGYLMPIKSYHNQFYQDKKDTAFFSLAGSPVPIEKQYFIRESKNFPIHLLKPYSIQVTKSFTQSMQDVYIVPSGIEDMINFNENNQQLVDKLKEYIELSEFYIHQELDSKENIKTQLHLLKLFRELYFIYIVDCYGSFSVTSDTFLKLYKQGQDYRTMFKKFNSPGLKLLKQSDVSILSSVFDNIEDLVLFEEATLNSKIHGKKFHNIPLHVVPLWKNILIYKAWAGSYQQSPYFEKFKKALLSSNYNMTAIQTSLDLLELLSVYEFSLLNNIYLTILKNCNKSALIEYIEEKLKNNNCLPEVSHTLIIKKESSVIYNDTFHLNFDFFKHHVKNHVYAAQCLIGIVEKSFKNEEKDCSKIHWLFVKDSGTIIFSIETIKPDSIETLSKKLVEYIHCVLSNEFLDEDMIKFLSKHSSNSYDRIKHEHNKFVTDKYLNIKNKFLLKGNLEKKLVNKPLSANKEIVKKI